MYVKKTKNNNYSKRYTDQFRADAVEAYKSLRAQAVPNAEQRIAEEFGCSRASVTAWFRADREAARLGLKRPNGHRSTPHPHVVKDAPVVRVKPPVDAAREEARMVAEVMADEAVSNHAGGGIHPTLTAYENAAERYEHQRSIVDTLHAELAVHTERLAELETGRDEAKKALQELVNSL